MNCGRDLLAANLSANDPNRTTNDPRCRAQPHNNPGGSKFTGAASVAAACFNQWHSSVIFTPAQFR
jgi:uracil-DNA glycosylase